jgi:hypothetical protein
MLGGALANALSAAASKFLERGTALTLSSAAELGSKGGSEGGAEEMEIVVEDEWLEERANHSMDEGGLSPTLRGSARQRRAK